jgi:hypothetical protein
LDAAGDLNAGRGLKDAGEVVWRAEMYGLRSLAEWVEGDELRGWAKLVEIERGAEKTARAKDSF